MSDLLIEKYGENAGFVQQWAFYYKRAKKYRQNALFVLK